MAEPIIVLESLRDWKSESSPLRCVLADDYLADSEFAETGLRVINLCRSTRYQSLGYYVSLLAEARGHRVVPSVATLQDLSRKILYGAEIPALARDLDRLDETTRARLPASFRVFLGRSRVPSLAPLARKLFEQFAVPLLDVSLVPRDGGLRVGELKSTNLRALSAEESTFLAEAVARFVTRGWRTARKRPRARFDLAILVDPEEEQPPSNRGAIDAFVAAGRRLGLEIEEITKRDISRLAEFDALFIRETTRLNHHTYAFSRRAEQEGLVVMDDPTSILRCTNKVYLAELLTRHKVGAPRAQIFGEAEVSRLPDLLGFPMVLKAPEGAFSKGVFKADDEAELAEIAARLLDDSELALAQEFMPTEFDWRVGVLGGKPLYVCQYLMAGGHWQIVDYAAAGGTAEGDSRTLAVADAPADVVSVAVQAANLIGDGLYGVDIKSTADGLKVIEINDNPSIDAGIEDAVLGSALYETIMAEFLRRLEQRTRSRTRLR
ncbi:MAG: RimK family protein [Salinisphaera sp.]|jgi:glutathione synthase/RimK-type ligase-like ATP-grasp enzyme|nr:RimK family protein [Salinisphaera sp.]